MRFRWEEQQPPPPVPLRDGFVQRIDGIVEISPSLMSIVSQQEMPIWDSRRIAASRDEWIRAERFNFADSVLYSDGRVEVAPSAEVAPGGVQPTLGSVPSK